MRAPWRRLTLVLALAAAPLAAGDDPDGDAWVERMGRVGRAYAPSFSPDGREIALLSDLGGLPQVWIVAAAGGWPRLVSAFADPVTDVAWSPAGDWLALAVAPGGGLNTQIYLLRPDGTGLRRLTAGGKENNRLDDWTPDGRFVAMTSNRRDPATMDAYLVDAGSGVATAIAELDGVGSVAGVTRDGRRALLSRLKSRGDNNLYLLDDLQSGARRETLLTPHAPPGQFFGELAADGRAVYLGTNAGRDRLVFGRIRLDAGATRSPAPAVEILAERADAELGGLALDPRGARAALLWNVAGRDELAFVDLASGAVQEGPALPAEIVGGVDWSPDGRLLALTLSGSAAPPDVWVLEVATGELRRITSSPHPGIDLAELVRPELVRYPAHDGLELSGWLYRPPRVAGPAPYVLSFHGGPEGQERPSFRNDYQALLRRGIGVFAPNVRGSSGFGKRFVNLDNGALRFDGVRDIRASADYLTASGAADPRRLGVMGGSYGGYMTMAALTEYPDLFAAGVNLFGVVNFETFFAHTEPWMARISTVEYGDPATQADLLRSLSPIHKLDRIRAALMVQHGRNDTNVPVVEAEQIVEDLRRRGVPVEYLLFPDEGHGWRKIGNRVRSTVETVRFFAQNLLEAPDAAAPGTRR
jgi:dipeptidyl aminopeptidase/acylaminoacyl peptidase